MKPGASEPRSERPAWLRFGGGSAVRLEHTWDGRRGAPVSDHLVGSVECNGCTFRGASARR